MEPHRQLSDDQLTTDADIGLRGQGALVEMMRRLKDAIDKLERTSSDQQQKIFWLTLGITLLTVFLGIVASLEVYQFFF